MKEYRAGALIDNQNCGELVLTTPEMAHWNDNALIDEARAELLRIGGTEEEGEIRVVLWKDANLEDE